MRKSIHVTPNNYLTVEELLDNKVGIFRFRNGTVQFAVLTKEEFEDLKKDKDIKKGEEMLSMVHQKYLAASDD
jgi:hypothetical protein